MAEFLNMPKTPAEKFDPNSGFNAMGRPVPYYRRQAGYEHALEMGCNKADAFAVVEAMCPPLERDEPYGAFEAGVKYVGLLGTYRMIAVLLATPPPTPNTKAGGSDE